MAIELRAENSYGTLLRIASIVGALASVGLMIWMLVQHWQTFMAWKAEAGFWPFFAGVAVLLGPEALNDQAAGEDMGAPEPLRAMLAVLGGVHGDEYEGQVGLCKMIRTLEPKDVRGRVIAVPGINLPAALAGARVSPIDNVNFNRAFPGDPNGTPTYAIAHYVNSVLFPMADQVIPFAQQDQVADDFERVEHEETGEGVHEKYLSLAEALEREARA